MEPIRIIYAADGAPTNLPRVDPLLLYGRDGEDAVGPVLGQWDTTLDCWSDDKCGAIDWYPEYFAIPPENPCKSIAVPTYGNQVV